MSILKLDKVTKRFGGLVAVDNVSMEIQQGEILGLIGPNGAGKTTLTNLISGVHMVSEGKLYSTASISLFFQHTKDATLGSQGLFRLLDR